MAYVRQRGEIWYVGFRGATGGWTEKASKAQSKTEARRLAADLERQAERQRLGLEAVPGSTAHTLASLCDWWLEQRCPLQSAKRERGRLTLHVVKRTLGNLPLRAVTTAVLEDHFRVLEKAGLAPGSINHLRSKLRTVFNCARKAGLWPSNPVADTERRSVPTRAYATLTPVELERLLAQVPERWRGFFAAAAYLGLRKGECAGLRKSDVDLERGTITIRASYDRETTKGGTRMCFRFRRLCIPSSLPRFVPRDHSSLGRLTGRCATRTTIQRLSLQSR